MLLPKKEATFLFEFEDDMGIKWEGLFTVKTKLTIADTHKMELERSRLLGDTLSPSAALSDMAYALPYIRIRVIEGPEWYIKNKLSDLEDISIMYALFDKIVEAEKQWKKELIEKLNPEKSEDLLGK
jgi:hypothetical protein